MSMKPPTEPLYWRGAICLMLGLFIVLGAQFMRSPAWRELLGGSQAVGWFCLVLGALFFWNGWRRQRQLKQEEGNSINQ